jgi:AcrR family transcriptional regulator
MIMSEEKSDRRVKYTRMVLRESLVALLQQRPIDKISVKSLCEAADINRSTFYSHYRDQYDLLQQIQAEVLEDLTEYLVAYNFRGSEADLRRIMKRIFEYIAANAALCQVLLADNGDASLQRAVMKIVKLQSEKELLDAGLADAEVFEYLLLYWVNGSMGMVHWWLQSAMKKSASEMADMVVTLTYNGMKAYINT